MHLKMIVLVYLALPKLLLVMAILLRRRKRGIQHCTQAQNIPEYHLLTDFSPNRINKNKNSIWTICFKREAFKPLMVTNTHTHTQCLSCLVGFAFLPIKYEKWSSSSLCLSPSIALLSLSVSRKGSDGNKSPFNENSASNQIFSSSLYTVRPPQQPTETVGIYFLLAKWPGGEITLFVRM